MDYESIQRQYFCTSRAVARSSASVNRSTPSWWSTSVLQIPRYSTRSCMEIGRSYGVVKMVPHEEWSRTRTALVILIPCTRSIMMRELKSDREKQIWVPSISYLLIRLPCSRADPYDRYYTHCTLGLRLAPASGEKSRRSMGHWCDTNN